jgi:hypothetical protein
MGTNTLDARRASTSKFKRIHPYSSAWALLERRILAGPPYSPGSTCMSSTAQGKAVKKGIQTKALPT